MKSLRSYRIKKERAIFGDIKVYNITTDEQRLEIKKMIEENSKLIQQADGQSIMETELNEIKFIKYLLAELTSLGDEDKDDSEEEISDEELIDIINNANSDLKNALLEVTEIIKEFSKDFMRNYNNQVDTLYEHIVVQSDNVEKMNEIANKLGVSLEELVSLSQDQQKLDELMLKLKEENNKKKLQLIPQDHKKSQEKKKRGRKPKKSEQTVIEIDGSIKADELELQDKLSEIKADVIENANL